MLIFFKGLAVTVPGVSLQQKAKIINNPEPEVSGVTNSARGKQLAKRLRYTQREFKLKFSALLKVYDGKYAENSKK